jgi:protein O-mannosyl-transferase
LSVESSIIPISQDVIYEHRTYLPGFGFYLVQTAVFFYVFKPKYLGIALTILLMIAALNTALTYQRNKIWKNNYTLWSDCIKKSPEKARVNNNFGSALFNIRGKTQEAIYYFDKSIRLSPDYAESYKNRGLAYYALGQYQQAIDDYSKAISVRPDYAEAYNGRGIVHFRQEEKELGCRDAQKACELGSCKTLELAKGRGACR